MTEYRGFHIYPSDRIAPAAMAWTYCHEDYDGASDSLDDRQGFGSTVEECKEQIDEWHEEREEP